MIKRQVAKRKEAAEEASRPKRCALNLGSVSTSWGSFFYAVIDQLLASQEQGDLREVPTGPVNLGTKPEDVSRRVVAAHNTEAIMFRISWSARLSAAMSVMYLRRERIWLMSSRTTLSSRVSSIGSPSWSW